MKFKGKIVKQGSGSIYLLVPKYVFDNGELMLVEGHSYWVDVEKIGVDNNRK